MLPDHLTRLHDETEPGNMHSQPRRPVSWLGSGFALNLGCRQVALPGMPAHPRHAVIPFSKTPRKRKREGAISRGQGGCQLREGMQKVPGKAAGSRGQGGLEGSCCSSIQTPHPANFYRPE